MRECVWSGMSTWHVLRGVSRAWWSLDWWSAQGAEHLSELQANRRCRFTAWASPFCLRIETVEGALSEGEDYTVRLGTPDCWWARREDGTLESGGAPVLTFMGFDDLEVLLRPQGWMDLAFVLGPRQKTEFAGRAAWSITGSPTDQLPWEAGGLHVPGADNHAFVVDAHTGVVLRWEALVGGAPVRSNEIEELEVDPDWMTEVPREL